MTLLEKFKVFLNKKNPSDSIPLFDENGEKIADDYKNNDDCGDDAFEGGKQRCLN